MPWLVLRVWSAPIDRTQCPQLLSLPLGPDTRATIEDAIRYYQSLTIYRGSDICCANPACRRSLAAEEAAVGSSSARQSRRYTARQCHAFVGRRDAATGDMHVCYYALCCTGTDCEDTMMGSIQAQLRADEDAA